MRHRKGETGLEEVDGEAEERFEKESADHQATEGNEESRGGVDADGADSVEGGEEGGVRLDCFGLYDKTDDGDDDGESQDFDNAVREDAEEQQHRAFALVGTEQPINPLEDGEDGVLGGGHVNVC